MTSLQELTANSLSSNMQHQDGLNLHSVRWRSPPDGPASWNRFIVAYGPLFEGPVRMLLVIPLTLSSELGQEAKNLM